VDDNIVLRFFFCGTNYFDDFLSLGGSFQRGSNMIYVCMYYMLRYRRKIGDRVERENIPNTLKTTISSNLLSTSDKDQSLIKLDNFIITKLLYVNLRHNSESINILEM